MKLFVAVSDDSALWSHFVNYYTKLGVTQFYVATLPSTPPLPKVDTKAEIRVFPLIDEKNCHMGAHSVTHNLRLQFCAPDEWHWITDLDEFHQFDRPVDQLLKEADAGGYNTVVGRFVDRHAADGSMPAIQDGDLFSQFPLESQITLKLLKGNDRKVQLLKGHLEPIMCYHTVKGENPFPVEMKVQHFKWNAACVERLKKRIKQLKLNGYWHQIESARFFDFWSKYGRIDLDAINQLK